MNLEQELNPVQLEAVLHTEGPLLILAGAGSGKTRVITYRIAHLIRDKGVKPWNLLAVTFTNKAAREMQERVKSLLQVSSLSNLWISTFHAACVRILRKNIHHLGFKSHFVIYDTADRLALLKECEKDLNIDEKTLAPKLISSRISNAKSCLWTPEEYKQRATQFLDEKIAQVYKLYQQKLKQNNALDFDDLLMVTVQLFQEIPEVLHYYQELFKYILVDEYQDTNHAQYRWIYHLAQKHRNLCVVGDDDQSIYAFRMADIRNILDFEKDYPEARLIKLEQNYRSTQNILDAAWSVVVNNRNRKQKRLWTNKGSGPKILLYTAYNESDEARFVCEAISQLHQQESRDYSHFAILYRINAQSRSFEESLIRANIPYTLVGGLKFYDRKEIKDLLAYLRVIANSEDPIALKRILNVPARHIGEKTLEKIENFARQQGYFLFQAMKEMAKTDLLPSRALKAIHQFIQLIEDLKLYAETHTVSQVLQRLLEVTSYREWLKEEDPLDAENRIENIQELLAATLEFEQNASDKSLLAFLDQAALTSDVDTYQAQAGMVTLMTLHSAKGLEFPVVFMVGMEEGLLPYYHGSSNFYLSEAEREEERRLCYVGMTRAKERLILTLANSRRFYSSDGWQRQPSSFIEEIPSFLLEKVSLSGIEVQGTWNPEVWEYRRGQEPFTPSYASSSNGFQVGDEVRHAKFGRGVVRNIEGQGDNQKVIIYFYDFGRKVLLAKQARLEHV
jgi:DNA helicase-2/ATP-dependent DNA helicase PcrA